MVAVLGVFAAPSAAQALTVPRAREEIRVDAYVAGPFFMNVAVETVVISDCERPMRRRVICRAVLRGGGIGFSTRARVRWGIGGLLYTDFDHLRPLRNSPSRRRGALAYQSSE